MTRPNARAYNATIFQWVDGPIPLVVALGPAGRTLSDGTTSWDAVAERAIAEWDSNLGLVQLTSFVDDSAVPQQGDYKNTVAFSNSIYGDDFGDETIAVTLLHYPYASTITEVTASNAVIDEADVLVNKQFTFDSYDGPLHDPGTSQNIDLHRVLLHEFGHVLGLDHPDKIRQVVTAIMNSVISDTDSLTADDIAGTTDIYGDPTLKIMPVKAADLVVDDARGKIYVSTPKGKAKGVLKVIDPYLQAVVASARTGPLPNVLRESGGHEHLYLGVDGLGAIDQIDPDTLATTLQFTLGGQAGVTAADIAVLPGAPESVLVSQVGNVIAALQHNDGANNGDFAVYDGGILRPEESFNSIADSGSPVFLDETGQTLYAFDGGYHGTVDGTVLKLTLEAGGVSPVYQNNYLLTGPLDGTVYSEEQLFVPYDGSVLDLADAMDEASFPDIEDGAEAVAVDASLGQVYFAVMNSHTGDGDSDPALLVEDIATRARLSTIELPRYIHVSRVARWGVNGLLFGLNNNQMLFIRSNLIAPGSVTDVLPSVTLGAPKFASLDENGGIKDKPVVTRTGSDLSAPLTVHYTVSGTAQNGVDFRALSGVVTIPANQATAKIKVVPLGSQFSDGPRTLQIRLAPDTAYRWGAASTVTISLTSQ